MLDTLELNTGWRIGGVFGARLPGREPKPLPLPVGTGRLVWGAKLPNGNSASAHGT